MDKFIACICNSDFNQLIVSGEPSALQLAEAWATLFYEYCDQVEATETIYRTRLITEIALEKRKIEFATGWVKILQHLYLPGVAEALKYVGFEYELDPEDRSQYKADLARINAELSAARLHLRIKEAEYESIIQNQSSHDSVDKKYFSTIFFRINNYAKREAVNGQTFVQDYCAALRDYVAHIESSTKTKD